MDNLGTGHGELRKPFANNAASQGMNVLENRIDFVISAEPSALSGAWFSSPAGKSGSRESMNSELERDPFDPQEIQILEQSIEIAEDLVSNHFKISTSDWKRYRYDIRSLSDLMPEEITDTAFAQIRRYLRCPHQKLRGGNPADYFKICLQDHVIRKATRRDPQIGLLPLAVYIVIHELIHVIRFARFIQRFDASLAEQEAEEARVHDLTFTILKNCRVSGIQEILAAFRDCRTMETFHGVPDRVSGQQG